MTTARTVRRALLGTVAVAVLTGLAVPDAGTTRASFSDQRTVHFTVTVAGTPTSQPNKSVVPFRHDHKGH